MIRYLQLVIQVFPQLLFPVGHVEACRLELMEREGRVHRPRGYGALGGCVVLGGGDRLHGIAVAVPLLEDRTCYVRPAPDSSRSRAAVGAICGMRVQEMEDGSRHVTREREPSQLVVHDGDLGEGIGRVCAPVGEGGHRLNEVVALAYDP